MSLNARASKKKLVPVGFTLALKRLGWQSLGLAAFIAGVACFIALYTAVDSDPSFNVIHDGVVQNKLGHFGSQIADMGFQLLGDASYLVVFLAVFWGVYLMRADVFVWRWWRLLAALVAIASFAALFSYLPAALSGGYIGNLVTQWMERLVKPWGDVGHMAAVGVLGIVFLSALQMAIPLTIVLVGRSFLVLHILNLTVQQAIRWLYRVIRQQFDLIQPTQPIIAAKVSHPPKPSKNPAPSSPPVSKPLPKMDDRDDSAFQVPPLSMLSLVKQSTFKQDKKSLQNMAENLTQVLHEFGVTGEIENYRPGPVVTLFELRPDAGIKSSRVISLADDIARSMSALSARIAVVPGRNAIGIELPNAQRETVNMRDMLMHESYRNTSHRLPLILGKDIGGEPVIVDLAKMPHLLVAGTTGSGKSVSVNTMIMSLLFKLSPDVCRFIMIDPKMLELSIYDNIPHLLTPVVTDPSKAVVALKWTVKEMEQRYQVMSKLSVRNIEGYNQRIREAREKGEVIFRRVQTGFDAETGKPVFEDQPLELKTIPYIVVIVDEMADLMLVAGKDIESAIQRLAQMARAAGIHLIMATQRPSVDVITGTIKANFPTRISFQVTSKIDSRTILGEQGAEQLLGQGDMLYMAGGGRISRVHGPFVSDDDVEKVVDHLRRQGVPDYIDDVTTEDPTLTVDGSGRGKGDDPLYDEAVQLVTREGKVSTSFIQRHLQIGYNRAARIVERMEEEGMISAPNGQGKREVLGRR
jgi:S-DNA-T family DNA segregation ATPase FtsK/SpoIIIE